jgi:hypothetical protein
MLLPLLLPTAFAASSDAALIAQVLAEYPELDGGGLTDWETVVALRGFAYTHTDTVVNVTSPYYSDQYEWSVSERYAWFDDNLGGVVCGGTGDALRLLYQLWGFDAWYLGFGDTSSGGFTHVETLVQIEHDGQQIITVQDAQLDASYTTPDGEPLDYLEFLGLLGAQDPDLFALTGHEDNGWADTLVHPSDLGTMSIEDMVAANWTSDPADYALESLADGGTLIRSPRTLPRLELIIGYWYGDFLEAEGLPRDLPWLHLYPLSVSGDDGASELLAAAQAAATTGRTWTVSFEADQGFAIGDAGGTINYRYDNNGFDVQSWYYGGTTIVACGSGQCLQAEWVDGHEGDYELMFDFQDYAWPQVSLTATSSVEGDPVRVAWYGADGALLGVDTKTDGTFSLASADAPIDTVIVEAAAGAVLVDELRFGPATADDEPTDTGGDSGGDGGDGGDGGVGQDSGDPGASDGGSATAGDSGGGAAADGGDSPASDAGCGCAGGSAAAVWLLLPLVGLRRRTREA